MNYGKLNKIVQSYDKKEELKPRQREALVGLGLGKEDLIVDLPCHENIS